MVVVALVLPAHGRHSLERRGVAAADGSPADAAALDVADAGEPVEEEPDRWGQIDWVGSWSLSAMVAGAMLAISIGPLVGWATPGVLVPAALAVVGLVIFVWRERTAEHPLIPVRYFTRRNFMLPMGARAFGNFAYFGGFFLFPLLMEQAYGWAVAAAGLVSVARPIMFSVSAPVAGYVTPRVGERVISTVGMLFVTASMVLFANSGAEPNVALLVLALCLAGTGMGVASPSMASTQANEVDPKEFGVTSAAQLLALQVGEVVGIQVSVTVLEAHTKHHGLIGANGTALLPSFRVAFLVGAVAAAVATVCSAFIRDLRRDEAAQLLPS
jgi:predicted MFS family arabinose efflux permease